MESGIIIVNCCKTIKGLFVAAILVLSTISISPVAVGEEGDASDSTNAVLLLDASGSMLRTDPLRLRDEGAKLFTQFLKADDQLAIIEFSKTANVIRPLSPLGKEGADTAADVIGAVQNLGEYTNLLEPIKLARELLANNGAKEANQVIILLSDGKMDPAPESGLASVLTNELFNNVLLELKAQGVKVYTLSFSDQVDRDLLSQIALATGGIHWFTPTSDKVHESFAELFLVVKEPQMLPLTSKGFRIDGEISEATFYINREADGQIKINSPGGEEYTSTKLAPGMKWFEGSKFDVITITDPEPGQWQVLGLPKNEGFATLLTDLKLVPKWPGILRSGVSEVLEAHLFESRKPVLLPRMTGVIKYAFQITPTDRISEPILREHLVDDGTNGDRIADDGVYSARLEIEEPGEYKLQVIASGPTFERHQQRSFRVKPRLVTLELIPAEESKLQRFAAGSTADGKPIQSNNGGEYFRVVLSEEASDLRGLEVILTARDAEKNIYELPLTRVGNEFEVPAALLVNEGEYTLIAQVTGQDRRRKRMRDTSRPLTYIKVPSSMGEQVVRRIEQPKEEKPGFPIIELLLVLLVNGGVGSAFFMAMRKEPGTVETIEVEGVESVEPIKAVIEELERRVAVSEVDFNDPALTDESIEVELIDPDLLKSKNISTNDTTEQDLDSDVTEQIAQDSNEPSEESEGEDELGDDDDEIDLDDEETERS